jgi:urea transporter/murein DD-endopeptidase MepM/ murein hydrolase activator NlpD
MDIHAMKNNKLADYTGSLTDGIINSYSQVFFSNNRIFSFILVLVTFFDFYAGLSGFLAVLASNAAACAIGFNRYNIRNGFYGFNSLLVGLGLGMYYEFNPEFILVLLFAALFTLLVSVMLEGVIGKYGLPYLSIPFLFGIWMILLAAREYSSLEVSQRGVYVLNEMYALGGKALVELHEWLYSLPLSEAVTVYFRSLGAIFFQYHLLPGILVAVGLLVYSRQAFLLSVLGFASAWVFYEMIGADISVLSYSYIGFNYILTAIAIGGFFIIPSKWSYLWVILLTPLTSFLITSTGQMFAASQLSIYSLPFNLVVIMFLYVIKFREHFIQAPEAVVVQHFSPEKNLYAGNNYRQRFEDGVYVALTLPFHGEWMVTQAHDDIHTHRDAWKHAWDFEIAENDGSFHKGKGLDVADYLCYDKPVLAPADGWVEEILDGIDDNPVGEVNLDHNWGNTIIIKHGTKLYTKLCHLRKSSFQVAKGDYVKRGQILASCGNSGRSPRPHLHFQVQSEPYVGAQTIDYPFAYYLLFSNDRPVLKNYTRPLKNSRVANIVRDEKLYRAFHFLPGQALGFRLKYSPEGRSDHVKLRVNADIYNNKYIFHERSNSRAWFQSEGGMLYFTHFEGDKKSFLYLLYLGLYKVAPGYHPRLLIRDVFPLDGFKKTPGMILQDFIAPFYTFIRADYLLNYPESFNNMTENSIELQSEACLRSGSRIIRKYNFQITAENGIISCIRIQTNKISIEAVWESSESLSY